MYQLTSLALTAIAIAARITANTNGAAVDVSDYTGNALFTLNASAPEGAAQTLDVKLQTSADGSTGWVDTGISFAQVTTAGGASFQTVMASTDGFKRYVRAVGTVGGSSPAVTFGITITGKKAR
jgi:hypothetical protein